MGRRELGWPVCCAVDSRTIRNWMEKLKLPYVRPWRAGLVITSVCATATSVTSTCSLKLRGSGLAIVENLFEADKRQTVAFERGVDVLIHHLGGLELATAERVQVTVRTESDGTVMFEEMSAPFDRDRGEVLVACQRHFAAYPPDVVIDVRVHRAASAPQLATFIIPHVFGA